MIAAILGGVVLFVGLLWGWLFPAERAWTIEKADRMSELSHEAHLLHMKVKRGERDPRAFGDEEPGAVQKEYRDVTEELAALKQEFESAQSSPKTIGNTLRIGGMVVLLTGLVGLKMAES